MPINLVRNQRYFEPRVFQNNRRAACLFEHNFGHHCQIHLRFFGAKKTQRNGTIVRIKPLVLEWSSVACRGDLQSCRPPWQTSSHVEISMAFVWSFSAPGTLAWSGPRRISFAGHHVSMLFRMKHFKVKTLVFKVKHSVAGATFRDKIVSDWASREDTITICDAMESTSRRCSMSTFFFGMHYFRGLPVKAARKRFEISYVHCLRRYGGSSNPTGDTARDATLTKLPVTVSKADTSRLTHSHSSVSDLEVAPAIYFAGTYSISQHYSQH